MIAHGMASWLMPITDRKSVIGRAARRFLGVQKPPRRLAEWSIGMYAGSSPFDLAPLGGVCNPILTCRDISDVSAEVVADPFMIQVDGSWFMFFEVQGGPTRKGSIGLATSTNGLSWRYERIVLAEPWHLSYPYVFREGSDVFMVPESCEARTVPLYKATSFPYQWKRIGTLIDGVEFADASPFCYQGHWWLLASSGEPRRRADNLHLFHANTLTGRWQEHPLSPVIRNDAQRARPGGRVLVHDGRLYRFAQDCYRSYGLEIRAFEITTLTLDAYAERELPTNPIVTASGEGWNGTGMHHVDPHQAADGSWFACVDGRRRREVVD
jgi:hypothetical protein